MKNYKPFLIPTFLLVIFLLFFSCSDNSSMIEEEYPSGKLFISFDNGEQITVEYFHDNANWIIKDLK